MPQQALCAALEKLINQALALNSQADQLNSIWQQLTNKSLQIYLSELSYPLCFTVNEQKILVTSVTLTNDTQISDCTINTSLKTLWQLKQEQQITELIKQDKLDLQGDIKVAQLFASLAEKIDIDWQSELAKHIGDIATHKVTRLGTQIGAKAKFAKQQISEDASEWLIHEKKLLVTKYELENFYRNVDQVNQQTQDISQRLTLLEQRLIAIKETSE